MALHCSHFWGRKAESVRFDSENTDCLCFTCHNNFEMNPAEYVEWKEIVIIIVIATILTLLAIFIAYE